MPVRKHAPVIAVDFDQTIYDNRTESVYVGASEVLNHLKRVYGADIVVFTCRARPTEVIDEVKWVHSAPFIAKVCVEAGIPVDDITATKPLADVYIDDKALRFEGDWWALESDLYTIAGTHPINQESESMTTVNDAPHGIFTPTPNPAEDNVPAAIDEALAKIRSIFASKNADYANTTWDSNFLDVARQMGWSDRGEAAEALIAVKQARLRSLRVNGSMPKNESTLDTKLDRAVYSVIALAFDLEG